MLIIVHKPNLEWLRFPGNSNLTPSKIEKLMEEGVWSENDLEFHGLKIAVPFSDPINEIRTGLEWFEEIDGSVYQKFETIGYIPSTPKIKTAVDYPLKKWQFKAMVKFLGLEEKILEVIDQEFANDPLKKSIVLSRYNDSDTYDREDPLLVQLAPLVGLSDEELDKAWMQIATMEK